MKIIITLAFVVGFAVTIHSQSSYPIELNCPSNSLFSQLPEEFHETYPAFGLSGFIFKAADDFSVDLPFNSLRFWGGWLYGNFFDPACLQEPKETFYVEIYDQDPVSGAVPVYSFTLEGTLSLYGYPFPMPYSAAPLYQIDIDFGMDIDIEDGWISIANVETPGRPCNFGWLVNSFEGTLELNWLYGYGTWADSFGSLFFCLSHTCPESFANAGNDATTYYGYPPMSSTQLNATGGVSYNWSPAIGLSNPNIANPIASPTVTTIYTVTVTDESGCMSTDDVAVTVTDVRCGNKMDKVLVCHVPPGNPANVKTKCVSQDAVPALLAQGSYLGPCNNGKSADADISEADIFRVSAYPNPFDNLCGIKVELPAESMVTIEVTDMMGRRVSRIHEGHLDSGCHFFQLEKPAAMESVYLLKVWADDEFRVIKLISQ
jgi:hypothetical protein